MNGGKQQLDPEAHQRELDLSRRTEALKEAGHISRSPSMNSFDNSTMTEFSVARSLVEALLCD